MSLVWSGWRGVHIILAHYLGFIFFYFPKYCFLTLYQFVDIVYQNYFLNVSGCHVVDLDNVAAIFSAFPNFDPPTFNQQPVRPPIQLQLREDNPVDLPPVFETKFKPQVRRNFQEEPKSEDTSVEVVGGLDDGPLFRETARTSEIKIPAVPVSISDDISGEEVNGVFAEVNSQKSSLF